MTKSTRYCSNPHCKDSFEGRADKKFCSSVCKSAHHNAITKRANQTIYIAEGIIRRNEKCLREFYRIERFRKEGIEKQLLEDWQFKFEYYSLKEENKKTAQYIFWSHAYGFEPLKGSSDIFLLHYRTL